MKKIKILFVLTNLLCFSSVSSAKWAGDGGKICFDTPTFENDLMLEVDNRIFDLTGKKGVLVDDLDVSKRHPVRVRNQKLAIIATASLKFKNPKDPRVKISQAGTGLKIARPAKECPWELIKGMGK